jgi:hypothetical protein
MYRLDDSATTRTYSRRALPSASVIVPISPKSI